MRDVYVLKSRVSGEIYAIADDMERATMEMAKFPASWQAFLLVENHDLLEEGD